MSEGFGKSCSSESWRYNKAETRLGSWKAWSILPIVSGFQAPCVLNGETGLDNDL